ncbi:MAG: carboxylate--amine ligase, partial [Verrucomicrobiota bacterium]
IPIIALTQNPKHPFCKTRLVERIIETELRSQVLIETLCELGPTLGRKAVLFPCQDASVLLVSRHRERLKQWYEISLPDPDVVEMLGNKDRFYAFAMEHDFPLPRTFFIDNEQEALDASEQLQFPCVIKPPLSTAGEWKKYCKGKKVIDVEDRETFLEQYRICREWVDRLIVQEWIPGDESHLYSCNGYFSPESKPLATFVARKLRQWPPDIGESCLGEECRNDEVRDITVRVFEAAKLKGLGYLELKQDARNGKHYIVEPNIGRPTGRGPISEAGGVELLYTMYCECLGLPLPENRVQQYRGTKWIYLRRDVKAALYRWRRGELTLKQWWESWRGQKAYAIFSRHDMKPFFADFAIRRKKKPSSGLRG